MPNDATRPESDNHPRFAIHIEPERLARLSMKELNDLQEVLHTISSVATAFVAQPRFGSAAEYNAAGDILVELSDWLDHYCEAVVTAARDAEPTTASDAKWRAWTILGRQADFTDSLADLSVMAAEAVRDLKVAELRERAT